MRGRPGDQDLLFYTINVESRIRQDHPLRSLKRIIDAILKGMSPLFATAYSQTGRPSVPPERLLKALLLLALYSIRSERQLVERIDTDLLFRRFLDMPPEDQVFDATAFTHNCPRLDEYGLTAAFFDAVLVKALQAGLCSDEHFSVDGSLIESYASIKSFRPKNEEAQQGDDSHSFKPRNSEVDFRGQKRTNDTHASRTAPEATLYRKGMGKEARLSHMGHALTENRHGLVMGIVITEANGTAECEAALALLGRLQARHARSPKTLGADWEQTGSRQGVRQWPVLSGSGTTRSDAALRRDQHFASQARDCGSLSPRGSGRTGANESPPDHGRISTESTEPQEDRRVLWMDEDGGRIGTEPLGGAMETAATTRTDCSRLQLVADAKPIGLSVKNRLPAQVSVLHASQLTC